MSKNGGGSGGGSKKVKDKPDYSQRALNTPF